MRQAKFLMISCFYLFTVCSVTMSTEQVKLEHLVCEGIVPDNNLGIGIHAKNVSQVSEKDFLDVITRLEKIYSPIIKKKRARLKMRYDWESPVVNAYASQDSDRNWIVTLHGGFARYPGMTKEAFALVVCHELGHHLGGAPLFESGRWKSWSSLEGQADYYAGLKCMRRYFEEDNNFAAMMKLRIRPVAWKDCISQFRNDEQAAVCVRTTHAGMDLARVFAHFSGQVFPELETPSQKVVEKTYTKHPNSQCRLDTYFQSAVCPIEVFEEVSSHHYEKGTCHRKGEFEMGFRPLCWFFPQ